MTKIAEKGSTEEDMLNFKNGQGPAKITANMNQPVKLKPLGLRGRAVFRQLLWVVIGNLGLLAAGMGLSIPAISIAPLTNPANPIHLTLEQSTWYASVNTIASPFGGLVMSYLLDKIGRKRTMFLANILAVLAWSTMGLSSSTNEKWLFIQLLVSRVFVGILISLATATVGVYAAEVSHPQIRGSLILGTSLSMCTGIMMMYVMGYFLRDNWRGICMICCGYSMITGLILIPMRESPNWLMSKGRKEEARASLKYFRGLKRSDTSKYEEFETEFSALEKSCRLAEGEKKPKFRQLIKQPEVYKPLLVMIGLFLCQQFSGNFIIIVYAVRFSLEAGVTIDPILCAIFIGLARFIPTCLMGPLLDKLGRRPSAIFSAAGMACCLFMLAAISWFPAINFKYFPVICIIVYIITSTLGLMTLPFVMIAELFPQKIRGIGAGIAVACSWIAGFFIIKFYPTMVSRMGRANVFAFYGCMTVLALLFVCFFLPETKGKTLQEIEDEFKYGKRSKRERQLEVEMKEMFVATEKV